MRPDLTFNYLHPARTTPEQPQNLLRPTWKGIGCGECEAKRSGNIAASYGLGSLYTTLNGSLGRVLTRPLAGIGQGDEVTYDEAGNVVVVGYTRWWGLWAAIAMLCGGAAAYHGYKRNNSIGWAIVWYFLGAWFPIITLPVAFAQGYAQRARGVSGFNGRMKRAMRREAEALVPDWLSKGQVRALSKQLRAHGMKLPKAGWCKKLPEDFTHREVCSPGGGKYMLVGWRERARSIRGRR